MFGNHLFNYLLLLKFLKNAKIHSFRVQSYPTESDSDRIIFGSDSSRNTETDEDQQNSEKGLDSKMR